MATLSGCRLCLRYKREDVSELDTQFKLYYQFLKHAFGLRYLPISANGTEILVRLDNHSSQAHKDQLATFCTDLPRILDRPDISVRVTFINSKKAPRLQICDVLMGAAGSHGNKMHLKREVGQRGMKPKQRLRNELCRYVYDALRKLDHSERGSRAFNWFETTGHDGDLRCRLTHKMRIWKFVPNKHRIDHGWQNDHLDARGNYQAPHLD